MKNITKYKLLASSLVLAMPATATADTYKNIWKNRQVEQAESKKSLLELEWCIAKSITDYGAPNVFHGENKVSISNFSGLSSFNSIEIDDLGNHRLVKMVRIQLKKTKEEIINCIQ